MPAMPATPPPDRKLTYEDYCAIPEDGMRHEIIDGVHYVNAAPRWIHQRIVTSLVILVGGHARREGLGELLPAPFDVRLEKHSVVQPDVLFLSRENLDRIGEPGVLGTSDLVIEVLSPSSRPHDQVRKLRLYEREGVPEYWIVDPEAERVEVYRRTEDPERFDRPVILAADRGDLLESPLLPGLTLPVAEICPGKKPEPGSES